MEDHRETYEPEKTLAGFLKGIFSEDRVAETVLRCGFTEEDLKVRQIKAVLPPETGTVQISVPEGKSAPKKYTPQVADVKLDRLSLPEWKSAPKEYTPRIADVKLDLLSLLEGKSAPKEYTLHIADVKLDRLSLLEGKSAPKEYTLRIANVKLDRLSLPEGKSAPHDYTLRISDVKFGCSPLPEGKSAPSDYTLQVSDVVMMWIELPAVEDGSHIGPLLAPKLQGICGIKVAEPFADDFPVFLPPKQTAIEAPLELVQACLNTVDDLINQMLCDRW